ASASSGGNPCDKSSGIGETHCKSTSSAAMSSNLLHASQLRESIIGNTLPPTMTAADVSLSSIDGQSGLRPGSAGMCRGTKWVWVSIASTKTFPRCFFAAHAPTRTRPKRSPPTYKQVGLFLFSMQPYIRMLVHDPTRCRRQRIRERSERGANDREHRDRR